MPKDKENLGTIDKKIVKAYQDKLPELMPLMDLEVLRSWQALIRQISAKKAKNAIDLINKTKTVFSAIPLQQRQKLLSFTEEFARSDSQAALTFFENTPLVMATLTDKDFEKWKATALDLTREKPELAIIFLDMTPKLLSDMEMEELLRWVEKGKELIAEDKDIAKAFFEGTFGGLANSFKNTTMEERSHLIDLGAQLAAINRKCIQSYFENAPEVMTELTAEDFGKWVTIGKKISEETSVYGSDYYNNSLKVLKKLNRKFYELIFKNAELLLKKDRLIAGIYFENLPQILMNIHPKELDKWVNTGIILFETNREIAIGYFRNSLTLLEDLDVTELEEWAMYGLEIFENDESNARLYFSLKSRSSKEFVEQLMSGVALKRVSKVLKYYAFGISGINFVIRSHNLLPEEHAHPSHPVVSGKAIYLTPTMKGHGDFEDNFRIYKLSVMHEVGHAKFGTSTCSVSALLPLFGKIAADLDTTFLEGIAEANGTSDDEITIDFAIPIALFPNPFIATDILGIIEDARIEYQTTNLYRGLRREFKKVKEQMVADREQPEEQLEKFMEAFLLVSLGHEAGFDLDGSHRLPIEKVRSILEKKIFQPNSTSFTSLEVTFDIYSMLEEQFGSLKTKEYNAIRNLDYRGQGIGISSTLEEEKEFTEKILERFIPQTILDLDEDEIMQEDLQSGPKCAIAKNWDVLDSYSYDEWDAGIKDYKSEWCMVYDVLPTGKSSSFYQDTVEHYNHEISLINRIFKMMKPVSFQKLRRQTDGDELDFDAITEAFTDRRCGINPTENLYIRRDKRERDVATLFLVDISASTDKELDNGKNILDVEKEALVIMIEALESIGDKYAIYAFSGDTRTDVEYYGIKDFGEKFSEDVEGKIAALEPAYNTRLGAAIRHSITKLKKVDAKIKLLILLSDGEPYDLGFADGKYQGQAAIEDTRMAIQEGNTLGMHFFCITVDSEASDYMDSIFSDVGYTILDNAVTLPERLPILYNHITT
ncbi:VWA domain-containing protein [Methanococcoides orientis]|uniref:nitric oxide reductase activation protein NorD n=1 Tax=Methanococcoides orientis TaxID=2822137 RepID=UPI001E2C9459|nr:VWA domain-containing protein [Methanococcoides orientis]UGV41049.1 VWA domain-containing protein [Methanococcoides orientis]